MDLNFHAGNRNLKKSVRSLEQQNQRLTSSISHIEAAKNALENSFNSKLKIAEKNFDEEKQNLISQNETLDLKLDELRGMLARRDLDVLEMQIGNYNSH